jgi:hypothetical protein
MRAMSSPIDPVRRAALLRRTRRSDVDPSDEAPETETANLPVPVASAPRSAPRGSGAEGGAGFAAQMLGQDGQKRGLRAGPTAIDSAKSVYNRTEWSGSRDRRARKGRITRTEV